ncbi:DUF2125 domain-containing protein [Brevundimonas vesicularis]|uniref:DUF2125 domain-containing protein n=1 Tax=Brevundimonas TaxID=41275 RepID=UPI0013E10B0F|nr:MULTISPECIES: DUF2125 domain-containing protein [Brevundimonas]NSX34344.1 DUF2125 domain-containing protein [Brevundimonas vesicularis]QIF80833.1 DUF2125 domain-containing protein [Brevundimonas sp. 'scallop']
MTDASTTKRHSRKGLYAPFILVLIALAAWTGWWIFLTRQIDTRLEAQVQSLRDAGWDIRFADKSINGWPFRTHVALTNLIVQAPSGHAIKATELTAEANAYQPTKWVVVAPQGLMLTRAGKGEVAVKGDAIRMSASGIDQRWPNLALEMVNPVFTAQTGAEPFPIARAARIDFYARPHLEGSTAPTDDVDVMFRLVDGQGRADGPVEGFAQDGRLTTQLEAEIGQASLLKTGGDAVGVFSAWTKAGGTFRNVRGDLQAGDSRATLSSDVLRADANGRLTGQVQLQAQKPLPALAGLMATRQGPVNRIGAAGAAAAAGAAEATGQEQLPLTLVFRDGRTWLGPFPLAPAPKLF